MKFTGDNWVWLTANGDSIHIQDMDSSHIENCIKMLQKKIESSYDSWGEPPESFELEIIHNNMVLELRLRQHLIKGE